MQISILTAISALLLSCPQGAMATSTMADSAATQEVSVNELATQVARFTGTTNPLDPTQEKILDDYVRAMTTDLGSDDPQLVMKAREELIEALSGFGTTEVFRQAFGKTFLRNAGPILEEGSTFSRMNAYRVMGVICTTESNEALADQLKSSGSLTVADRVFAANMLTMALKKTPPTQYRSNMRGYLSIVTSILNSARKEQNWVALQRQFECLANIASDARIGTENQENELRSRAIQAQAMVLEGALNQIESGDGVELAKAVPSMILMLRSEYIKLDRLRKQKFSTTVAPKLVMVLETGEKAWDKLQDQEQTRKIYGNAVFQAAVLTRLVRGSNNTPKSNPDESWRAGEKSIYGNEVSAWSAAKNP